jgi:hypothetical protein
MIHHIFGYTNFTKSWFSKGKKNNYTFLQTFAKTTFSSRNQQVRLPALGSTAPVLLLLLPLCPVLVAAWSRSGWISSLVKRLIVTIGRH